MMKYTTIGILLIAAIGCAKAEKPAIRIRDPGHGLEPYVDLDLPKLCTFQADYERVTGEPLKLDPFGLVPLWVSRFDSDKAAWMLIQVYPGYAVPDISYVQVYVFDKTWNRICKQSFPTGYRMFLNEAKIATEEHLSRDLLVVKTTCAGPFMIVGEERKPAFEEGNFQRQYYAFLHDKLVMVRLEDDEARLVRNSYCSRSPFKGPSVAKRTPDEWLVSLHSGDPVQLLATLVWLTGGHLSSTEPRLENHNQEGIEDSQTFEAVRDSPRTRELLKRFRGSENPWVREYAELALSLVGE